MWNTDVRTGASFSSLDVSFAQVNAEAHLRRCQCCKGNTNVYKGDTPSTEMPHISVSPDLDVRLARVILMLTSVDVSIAKGILMFIGGANLAPICPAFVSSPTFM